MSPEELITNINSSNSLDNYILKQAILMTEVALDLKERYAAGEKYVGNLKSVICGAEKSVGALKTISRSSFDLAQKLIQSKMSVEMPENVKQEFENLQGLIKRELNSLDVKQTEDNNQEIEEFNLEQLADKIRSLETKNRTSDNNIFQANPTSSRSSKVDINEKYPENLSRESLIDLSSINLPPVPEDIFTSFSNIKPTRTSSLSSLKSMRKIKLFLQKAESSDDEDSSDNEEQDYSRMVYGDSDEVKISGSHIPSPKKLHLGYIKEEAQD